MSVFLGISGMILSILSRRFYFSLVNLGEWRKKWFNVSISKPQLRIGWSMSKKLCINVWFLKWLRPTRRWLRLKTSLLRVLRNFKIFSLKGEYEGELRISESNLFHSTNADVNNELSKKLFLILNCGISKFRLFLVWYEILFEGINSYYYFRDWSLTILWKTESFRNHFEEILILVFDKAS